jgi:hypothetical protein
MHHRTFAVGRRASQVLASIVAVAAVAALPSSSRAVISYNNATGNTTAPAGDQGWSYTGTFAAASGVAIAPMAFLATVHQGGNVGDQFELNGSNYTTTSVDTVPGTDLRVWHVSSTLNAYTQLYTGNPVGQSFTDVGYGIHTLGAAVGSNGWQWGSTLGKSWGTNIVDSLDTQDGFHELKFDFDPTTNEGVLANKDSGGGVFILDGGVWKVAGINYGLDAVTFSQNPDGSAPFDGAIYDKTGLFRPTGPGTAVSAGTGPVIAYAHDVSFYASEIQALVPEPGSVCLMLAPAALALTRRRRRRSR